MLSKQSKCLVRFGNGTGAMHVLLGLFHSQKIQTYSSFASYMVGQVLMYDRLVAGSADGILIHVYAFFWENLEFGTAPILCVKCFRKHFSKAPLSIHASHQALRPLHEEM